MKLQLRRLLAVCLSFCMVMALVPIATAAEEALTPIEIALDYAKEHGFCYIFRGDDQIFDGTRVISGTNEDIARLQNSISGTLLVRYQTSENADQVIFAAGKDTTSGHYGAILANTVNGQKYQRIDFPGGLYANLMGTSIDDNWHTFIYSVNAENLSERTGKTVLSFDGSMTTQFPDYTSWFNYDSEINDIQYLNIGGAPGALENSSNSTNFVGRIAFVAFIPTHITQGAASILSGSEWPPTPSTHLIYSATNIEINSPDDALDLKGTERVGISSPNELEFFQSDLEHDLFLYRGNTDYEIVLKPDRFLVVFPSDAHKLKMQIATPKMVTKAVFKVKIT